MLDVEVRSPDVVPPFASSVSIALEASGVGDQHVAGRHCAVQALERLRPSVCHQAIGRGAAGEPVWPSGITGSVTHTHGLASAAVAWLSDAQSIGIDSEMRVEPQRAERVKPLVMLPEESNVGGAAFDAATRVTLVFSAKEAIFKCLYPVVGRRFYYEDARIISADPSTGCFAAELMTTLAPGLERGTILRGRFEIDDVRVHTGVWLEPLRP